MLRQASPYQVPFQEPLSGSTSPRPLTSPTGPSSSRAHPDTPPSLTSAYKGSHSHRPWLHCRRAAFALQPSVVAYGWLSHMPPVLGACAGKAPVGCAVHRIIGLGSQPKLNLTLLVSIWGHKHGPDACAGHCTRLGPARWTSPLSSSAPPSTVSNPCPKASLALTCADGMLAQHRG